MNDDVYRFQVGHLQCTAISDGTLTYAPPAFPPAAVFLFANAPKDALDAAASSYGVPTQGWREWTSTYTCLLINTGKNLILVDTGAGSLAPSTGRLVKNLRSEGISPQDIDMVVLTHAHPDHVGGITNAEGQLVFPAARYFIGKTEWDFWMSGEAEARLDQHSRDMLVGIARRSLGPIKGRLEAIDTEAEIVSGVGTVAAPGHTPGQMGLTVSSEGQTLLCVSDVVLHPIHLEHPEWHAAVDTDPAQTKVTRDTLLHKASVEQSLVFAFHLPFPGLGHVAQKGPTWKWQPL